MKLAVLGPNGIEDATFHVHRAGCRDVARQERKFLVEKHNIFDVVSERELIEDLYMDFIGQETYWGDGGELTTWQDYQYEVRFFPCTSGMPAE
jgi:hypothetical protein